MGAWSPTLHASALHPALSKTSLMLDRASLVATVGGGGACGDVRGAQTMKARLELARVQPRRAVSPTVMLIRPVSWTQ